MGTPKQQFEQLCQGLSFGVSESNQQSLLVYLEQLEKWNKTYNLTAIKGHKNMLLHHIMDSLVVSPYLQGEKIADVGTGAGLPGIPLAILHPEKSFILIDSNGKKIRFIRQVAHQLGITNLEAKHSRVELIKEKVDTVISRAFASLQDMISSTAHLLDDQGVFQAMKGKHPEQEIEDLDKKFIVFATHNLEVPGLFAERCLINIKQK